MDLKKEFWDEESYEDFILYLKSLSNVDKIDWTKRILNTNKMVLALSSPDLKKIASLVFKGNYESFLKLNKNSCYEEVAIYGFIINKIKDFDLKVKYLSIYVNMIDSWALTDLLSFDVKHNEKEFYNLSLEYVKDERPFVRRIGLFILFEFIDNDNYIEKIFDIMNEFKYEEDYYVNMMNAWLLCEIFIKRRDETLIFLKNHNLNKFTINKGISKCRDSYRVSDSDKDMLLSYRVK
ncbi:MAG: DNA alkylation repair protein [Bacilli bacterium]|nr:DNA alkylation repair protein [Bacilli bacterium]